MNESIFKIREIIFGVLVVLPFTILLSGIFIKIVKNTDKNKLRAQNRIMFFFFLKLIFSAAFLFLAVVRNLYFFSGVFIGLIINLFIYPLILRYIKL